MLIKRPADIKASDITDQAIYKDRRRFIRSIGLLGAAASAGYLLSSRHSGDSLTATAQASSGRFHNLPTQSLSSDEPVTDYADATTYNNFYELGNGKSAPAEQASKLAPQPWSVSISGECEKPGVFQLEDILKPHDLEERIYRLRCVETWSMVIPWVGFSLGDLLRRFKPSSQAKYVEFRTLHDPERLPGQLRATLDWPYREGLRIDEAMHPLATLAVGMYGEQLPNQNGAPLRLVVPWKYGFKSIKSIVAIRFVRRRPLNTWHQMQPQEYGFYANVNPEVAHPRWSQARERRIGQWSKQPTLPFNGYAEQVAQLYHGMDLHKAY
jgi:sulfoxide reductase catalytic subunit YedY